MVNTQVRISEACTRPKKHQSEKGQNILKQRWETEVMKGGGGEDYGLTTPWTNS